MSSLPDLIIRGRHVVLDDTMRPAAVHVSGGVIRAVAEYGESPSHVPVLDVGDAVVLPGLVDTHVHINEPGRTEWEGFDSATRAAAAGGVTTLIEMPLNSIPATTSVAALRTKAEAAAGRVHVDVGFWGGVVPGKEAELGALYEAGVFGFKCFLTPSGVAEFEHVTEAELRRAMPVLAELGAPLLVHAESPRELARAAAEAAALDPRRYASYLRSRPPAAEVEAISLVVRLCREFGTRVHIVHLATADALPVLQAAREEGLPLTVETCPHYLRFTAEDIEDGATHFKCAPPIRDRENRGRLWSALGAGMIDMIASDHSPCPPALKVRESGDFFRAWGGIASLQLGLAAVWRDARERGYTPCHLAEWMSRSPAALAGLNGRKGRIAPGHDADLVVWEPDADFLVEPGMLHHRHKETPYLGSILPGTVQATYLRGTCVYRDGEFAEPRGQILFRGTG